LDELEKMVVPLFEDVKNKNVVPLKFEPKDHPWGVDQLGKRVYVVPVKEVNSVKLIFAVPDIVDEYEKAVSFEFL